MAAPSRAKSRQIAAPMPPPAPVTIATFPCKRPMSAPFATVRSDHSPGFGHGKSKSPVDRFCSHIEMIGLARDANKACIASLCAPGHRLTRLLEGPEHEMRITGEGFHGICNEDGDRGHGGWAGVLVAGPALAQGRWTSLKPIPQGEEEVYGTTAGGKLYVLGGLGIFPGWQPKQMLWSFDPATNEWTRLPNIPEGIHHPGFAAVGG